MTILTCGWGLTDRKFNENRLVLSKCHFVIAKCSVEDAINGIERKLYLEITAKILCYSLMAKVSLSADR